MIYKDNQLVADSQDKIAQVIYRDILLNFVGQSLFLESEKVNDFSSITHQDNFEESSKHTNQYIEKSQTKEEGDTPSEKDFFKE